MKYPEDFVGKIINSDCLEVMKQMPDKCVDLVLTDPPYGIGEAAKANERRGVLAKAKNYGKANWDNEIPSKEIFDEVLRISKNQIIWGGNYFVEYLKNSPCWLVWDKDNGLNDFADCELAWTSFPTAVRKFKWRWQGMLQEVMGDKEIRQHPTQKPQPLMEWCLENYSEPDALILDPFLGSGTTAVAAKKLGRRWIGIEISKEYCTISEQRLKQGVLNF